MMDRRNFLRSLVGGVAATAAVRTWPFRIYSFPSQVVTPSVVPNYLWKTYSVDVVLPDEAFCPTPLLSYLRTEMKRRQQTLKEFYTEKVVEQIAGGTL